MALTRDQIERFGNAPSEREETACQNTVESVKRTLRGRFGNSVNIYLQGSYRNRTNIKKDSDVDIVVEHPDYYFPGTSLLSADEKAKYDAMSSSSDYTFEQFKRDVYNVLQTQFGARTQRKNKCVFISKDIYSVNADVVPCYTYKRFSTAVDVTAYGIAFKADDNGVIESFPKQHYENGANKNLVTDGRYKGAVRVLKNVCKLMMDGGQISDKLISSFLIECLVWNVPNADFNYGNLYDVTKQIIYRVWNALENNDKARSYAEVSDLRWLLRGSGASTTIENARAFMKAAWNHIGYQS